MWVESWWWLSVFWMEPKCQSYVSEEQNSSLVAVSFPAGFTPLETDERDPRKANVTWFCVHVYACGAWACLFTLLCLCLWGLGRGSVLPPASRGRHCCHHSETCGIKAAAAIMPPFGCLCYGSICWCSETLLPGFLLPNYPNHMFSSAVRPTSPSLLGVRHHRSTTGISVGISTACAWLW